ncbi:MAG TPA: hypothetical protein VIQ74_18105, partial [Gemmatimonadaceae bacterium]
MRSVFDWAFAAVARARLLARTRTAAVRGNPGRGGNDRMALLMTRVGKGAFGRHARRACFALRPSGAREN